MSHSGNPRPLAQIAADLGKVITYFEELGLSLKRGRIRAYADVLDAAGRGEHVDRALLWSAACEVSDLVAASSLDSTAIKPVRHRLEAICGGDPVFTAQSGADPGRNLCFELVTAAMFQAAGVRSELQNPSDVTSIVAGSRLLVECKRPTTLPALGRRLQQGYRQLSEHRRNGHVGFGAIALEVSALVNPDFGVLVAKDTETAVNNVYGHIQKVFRQSSKYLARAARNARHDAGVHLLLFRVQCMTGDGLGPPNVTTTWHLEPTVALSSPEFKALYELMKKQPAFTPGVTVIDPDDSRLPKV